MSNPGSNGVYMSSPMLAWVEPWSIVYHRISWHRYPILKSHSRVECNPLAVSTISIFDDLGKYPHLTVGYESRQLYYGALPVGMSAQKAVTITNQSDVSLMCFITSANKNYLPIFLLGGGQVCDRAAQYADNAWPGLCVLSKTNHSSSTQISDLHCKNYSSYCHSFAVPWATS